MSAPDASTAHDDLAASTATRLHSAAIHLLRRLRREDDASGLSAPRLSALSVIVFGGPLSLGALAAAEQVRPPTMTRIVAALEAASLVTREVDPHDGRAILIRATPAGQASSSNKAATAAPRSSPANSPPSPTPISPR